MTYSLPFGLKQKPLAHYVHNGVVKFKISEGKLFFIVKHIMKSHNVFLFEGLVKNKEQLDSLLSTKRLTDLLRFREIPTIEEVVS